MVVGPTFNVRNPVADSCSSELPITCSCDCSLRDNCSSYDEGRTLALPLANHVDLRIAGLYDMRMEPAADQIQNDPGERPRARPDRKLRCALALTAQADRCMLAMACCFDQRLHRIYISGVDLCNGGRCHSNTFWTALAHRQRVVSLGAQRSSCALRWTRTASPSAARSSTTASSWPTSSQRSQVRTRQRSIRVRVRVSGCQGVRVSGCQGQGSGFRVQDGVAAASMVRAGRSHVELVARLPCAQRCLRDADAMSCISGLLYRV